MTCALSTIIAAAMTSCIGTNMTGKTGAGRNMAVLAKTSGTTMIGTMTKSGSTIVTGTMLIGTMMTGTTLVTGTMMITTGTTDEQSSNQASMSEVSIDISTVSKSKI